MIDPLEPRRLLSVSDADLAFGDNGIAVADVGPEAAIISAVAQPDGKIVVAGRQGSNALLARFNGDGSLDTTFAQVGYTRLNLGANERFIDVFILGTGKILVAGNTSSGVSSATGFFRPLSQ
jgi:hypothetical protein